MTGADNPTQGLLQEVCVIMHSSTARKRSCSECGEWGLSHVLFKPSQRGALTKYNTNTLDMGNRLRSCCGRKVVGDLQGIVFQSSREGMQGPCGPGSLRLLPVGNERRVKETAVDVVNGENDQGGCCKYIVHIEDI